MPIVVPGSLTSRACRARSCADAQIAEAAAVDCGDLVDICVTASPKFGPQPLFAVAIVTELVAATLVAWNEVDLEGHAIAAVMSPPPEQFNAHERATMEAAFIEHVADRPVIAHYRRTRDGRPYAISDS